MTIWNMLLARSRRPLNRHNNPAPVLSIRVHSTLATAEVGKTEIPATESRSAPRYPATKCPGSFPQHFRDRDFGYLASVLAGLESWGLSFGLRVRTRRARSGGWWGSSGSPGMILVGLGRLAGVSSSPGRERGGFSGPSCRPAHGSLAGDSGRSRDPVDGAETVRLSQLGIPCWQRVEARSERSWDSKA
ncbi:MAG: hypothetical protein AAFY20_15095 [Cyanobacteria bacterium J06639_14]